MSNGPALKLKAWPVTFVAFEKINEKGYPYYVWKLEGKAYKDDDGNWQNAPLNEAALPQAIQLLQEAYKKLKMETIVDKVGEPQPEFQGNTWTGQDLNEQAKEAFS